MPVNIIYRATTHRTGLQVGDKRIVKDLANLPAAPAGMKWVLERSIETTPAKYEFRLEAAPTHPDASKLVAGEFAVVREGDQPPAAPAGMEWRMHRMFNMVPKKYKYMLVEKDPRVDVGDMRTVLREEALPKTPDGMIWDLAKTIADDPKTYEYQLIVDTNIYLGDTRDVRDESELPAAPKDTYWAMTHARDNADGSTDYRYELVAGAKEGPTAGFIDALSDAFADGRVNRREAIRMIGSASNTDDNAYVYAAYLNRRSSHDRDARDIISTHLDTLASTP